jgi:hypothetical protein
VLKFSTKWEKLVSQGSAQDCWSAYIFFKPNSLFHGQNHYFFIFHNFMFKINTFFAEWWSGPTSHFASADKQGQNTGLHHIAYDYFAMESVSVSLRKNLLCEDKLFIKSSHQKFSVEKNLQEMAKLQCITLITPITVTHMA